jgi:hypothetical protein
MPSDSTTPGPDGFSRRSARERAAILEELRERQIQTLAGMLKGEPEAQTDMPSLHVAGALITHLSEAIEVFKKSADRTHDRRFAIIAIGLLLLLLGTFLFLPLRSTAVLVETKSRGLSFTVAEPRAALFRGASAAMSVELSGIDKVYRGNAVLAGTGGGTDSNFRIEGHPGAANPGRIGLSFLEVPAGTRVKFLPTGSAQKVEIAFHFENGQPPPLDFDVEGDFGTGIGQGQLISFAAPTRLEAIPRGSDIVAVFAFASRETIFQTPLEVRALAWTGQPGSAIEESSILSGKVTLDEIGRRSVTVRAGDPLRIGSGLGTIRQLSFNAGTMTCAFDGTVKELSTGPVGRRRNLMPTWLSWIRAQDALVQFWALFGSLAGLALAINHWWRVPE